MASAALDLVTHDNARLTFPASCLVRLSCSGPADNTAAVWAFRELTG